MESFKYNCIDINFMEQEKVTIPRKIYEELLEEVGILRNSEMMDSINESENAKKEGAKTWELEI